MKMRSRNYLLLIFYLSSVFVVYNYRSVRKIGGRCKRLFLSVTLPAVYQLGVCTDRVDAVGCSRLCWKPATFIILNTQTIL